MARCHSCDVEIRWVLLPSGKRMPVDAEPHQAGGVVFDGCADADGEQKAHCLKADEPRTGDRYRSHFQTCPQAAQHRRPR